MYKRGRKPLKTKAIPPAKHFDTIERHVEVEEGCHLAYGGFRVQVYETGLYSRA